MLDVLANDSISGARRPRDSECLVERSKSQVLSLKLRAGGRSRARRRFVELDRRASTGTLGKIQAHTRLHPSPPFATVPRSSDGKPSDKSDKSQGPGGNTGVSARAADRNAALQDAGRQPASRQIETRAKRRGLKGNGHSRQSTDNVKAYRPRLNTYISKTKRAKVLSVSMWALMLAKMAFTFPPFWSFFFPCFFFLL